MSPKTIRKLSTGMIERGRKSKVALARRLEGHPDVVGIGVGFRERNGHLVQRCCIRVHVRRKFHRDAVPRDLLLPNTFEGFPVDVIRSAYRSHTVDDPSTRFAPLVGGIVVANARRFQQKRSIGTAGCIVVNAAGEVLLLSNWHVLYGADGVDGETVVQPRPLGTLNDIGKTVKGILNEQVDCAVALLTDARRSSRQILGISGTIGVGVAAVPGMLVRKFGANGLGLGLVSEIHFSGDVEIEGTRHSFVEQIVINPRLGQGPSDLNVDDGDSGALWVTEEGSDVVGLHVGGDRGTAVASPIGGITRALLDEGVDLGL